MKKYLYLRVKHEQKLFKINVVRKHPLEIIQNFIYLTEKFCFIKIIHTLQPTFIINLGNFFRVESK